MIFGILFVPITSIIFIWLQSKSTALINFLENKITDDYDTAVKNQIVNTHQVTHSEIELAVRRKGANSVIEAMGYEVNKDTIADQVTCCEWCCINCVDAK